MPPKSERQRRAMGAAKSGKSTLGIPRDVGEDFISSDRGGKLPETAPKPKGKDSSARGLSAMLARQRKGRK